MKTDKKKQSLIATAQVTRQVSPTSPPTSQQPSIRSGTSTALPIPKTIWHLDRWGLDRLLHYLHTRKAFRGRYILGVYDLENLDELPPAKTWYLNNLSGETKS